VVPIAAHELDYRYALSAVPFACLALGLALAPKRVTSGAVAAGGGASRGGASGGDASGDGASGDGASGDGMPPAAAAETEELPAETDEG
jgi:hypothetical protein